MRWPWRKYFHAFEAGLVPQKNITRKLSKISVILLCTMYFWYLVTKYAAMSAAVCDRCITVNERSQPTNIFVVGGVFLAIFCAITLCAFKKCTGKNAFDVFVWIYFCVFFQVNGFFVLSLSCSASGASVVAIDNKIEQAMVSLQQINTCSVKKKRSTSASVT